MTRKIAKTTRPTNEIRDYDSAWKFKEIIHIEEEHKMSYIPTWERRAEQKGREEGVVLGRKEGARSKEIDIARKLLRKGIALEIISETTGLSQAEIESLEVKQ